MSNALKKAQFADRILKHYIEKAHAAVGVSLQPDSLAELSKLIEPVASELLQAEVALHERIAELEQRARELDADRKHFAAQWRELVGEVNTAIPNCLAQLEHEIGAVEQRVDAIQTGGGSATRALNEIAELNHRLRQKHEKQEEFVGDVLRIDHQIRALQQQVGEFAAERIRKAEERLDTQGHAIGILQEQLQRLQSQAQSERGKPQPLTISGPDGQHRTELVLRQVTQTDGAQTLEIAPPRQPFHPLFSVAIGDDGKPTLTGVDHDGHFFALPV